VGPLAGVRIVEFSGIGPAPFCAMMLADMGAKVMRIDRKQSKGRDNRFEVLLRGRPSLAVDLKTDHGRRLALRFIHEADALIEGFRPDVMDRLQLGPEVCLAENPRLIYARMTGWGQTGPLRNAAGHDINYIALTGALHAIGPKNQPPVLPLNLLGDFGGGGMLLAYAVVCGILEARASGKGQTIDAAMTDGAALLMSMIYGLKAAGQWSNARGSNLLDGGSHFYRVYECADRKYVAIGAIEDHFYEVLLEKIGMEPTNDTHALEALFKSRPRNEWCKVLEGTNACFAPVLDFDEAPEHPHNFARQTFIHVGGVTQPAPAPRFGRTPASMPVAPTATGEVDQHALEDWGFSKTEVQQLIETNTI
jgi:alpha-methylacyl-CoA racemase